MEQPDNNGKKTILDDLKLPERLHTWFIDNLDNLTEATIHKLIAAIRNQIARGLSDVYPAINALTDSEYDQVLKILDAELERNKLAEIAKKLFRETATAEESDWFYKTIANIPISELMEFLQQAAQEDQSIIAEEEKINEPGE